MPKLVKLESDSNVSNYTPASGNITTFLAASGSNIVMKAKKSDGSIVTLGGGGTFDIVKVTAYTPAEAALEAPSQVVVSGLTTLDDDTDVSYLNGAYAVTSATQRESTLKKRIYSMTSSGTTYYLYYYDGGEDESYNSGWCLSTNTTYGAMSAQLYNQSMTQLASGTATWYNEMGGSASVTLAVTTTSYPAVTQVLQGNKATDYVPSTKTWTFSGTTGNFTSFEKTPIVNGIFAAKSTALIGAKLSITDIISPDDLLFYSAFDSDGSALEGSYTPSTTPVYGTDGSRKYIQLNSMYLTTSVLLSDISGDFTFSAWVNIGNEDRCALLGAHDADTRIGLDTNGGTYNIWAGNSGWNILEADSGYSGSETDASGRSQAARVVNTWQHVLWTRSGNYWKLYLNGTLSLTKQRSGVITTGGYLDLHRWGNGGMITSLFKMSAVRIYSRCLTAAEIATLYGEF